MTRKIRLGWEKSNCRLNFLGDGHRFTVFYNRRLLRVIDGLLPILVVVYCYLVCLRVLLLVVLKYEFFD